MNGIIEKINQMNKLLDEINKGIPEDLESIPQKEFDKMVSMLEDSKFHMENILDSICEGGEAPEEEEGEDEGESEGEGDEEEGEE